MDLVRFLPDVWRLPEISKRVQPYTLVGPERMANLYQLARQIEREKRQGDVVECGVCNGGTAAILAHFATHSSLSRTVWLFDSFEGMPPTSDRDGTAALAHVGKEVGDLQNVYAALEAVGAELRRVRIIKGWFQDTFPTVAIPKISLLNIDADWYESVRLCLETFYDQIEPGGFVSIDDYGHWPGCKRAVDEFIGKRRLQIKLQRVDYTAHWFQKQ